MKYLILLSLAFVMAVCPFAATEKFVVELNENGSNTDFSDFGLNIFLKKGTVDQDCHLVLKSIETREVFFDGDVKAGESFPIGVRSKSMALEITNGTPNSTANCSVEWGFGKTQELFSIAMNTDSKGNFQYKSLISTEAGSQVYINNFMTSHDCTIEFRLDQNVTFRKKIKASKIYDLGLGCTKNMNINVKKGPKNAMFHMSVDIAMTGETMIRQIPQQADSNVMSLLGVDNEDPYAISFSQNTDATGCVNTDSYSFNPKGVRPEIRLLVVNQEFKDLVLKINDTEIRPELGLVYNGSSFYRVDVSLTAGADLSLALVAEGGKPSCDASFAFICQDFEENE